jgi:hypothetical protein
MAKQFGEIEDSGERRGFDSGAKRDVDDNKPRFDLIPITVLRKVVQCYDYYRHMKIDQSDFVAQKTSSKLKARMLSLGFLWGASANDEILMELIWICIKIIGLQENDIALPVESNKFHEFHIISPKTYLRIANHYSGGAKKYDPWNWSKGMPHSVFHASLMRHIFKVIDDETNEDHWSAIFFNAAAILHFNIIKRDDVDDVTPRLKEWGDYASS